VERRDRAIAAMRERHARHAHMIGLATLAAGAAHELSTPLGTIAVAARELERSLDEPAGAAGHAEDIRLIRAEIDRCRRVLDDMAGRTGEAVGEAPAARQLAALLRDAIARLTSDDLARVQLDVPEDLVVRWPPAAMSRALANLIQNGLQASGETDVVTVSASNAPAEGVVLTIRDHGRGMSAGVLSRAGEPFFTTKPERGGMGLGLFVARSTIEQLGGTIRLTSAEDRGTTVECALARDVAL
jgi:two-component system sensor histidine kinase RegB